MINLSINFEKYQTSFASNCSAVQFNGEKTMGEIARGTSLTTWGGGER